MYNAAPILPLAFEAFMIPCIRALPTPGPRPKKPSFMSISPRWCWICLGLMPTIISPSIKNSWQVLHDITRMFECYPMNNTIFNRAHHVSLILLLVIYFHTAVDLLFFTHRWCLSAVVSSPLKHPPKKHNGSPIREGRLRGIQLMQQDLAGVHGLKDGHLIPRMRTAIELKFPIGLKICVSICVYIYISLSLLNINIYIYITMCSCMYTHAFGLNILEAGDKSYRHQPWISNWDKKGPSSPRGQSCMHLMNLPVFKGTTPGNHRKT